MNNIDLIKKEVVVLLQNVFAARLQEVILYSSYARGDFKEYSDIDLDAITKFNIEARYQDYKLAFYKRCTKQYAGKWKKEIEDLRKWLKNQI
jgi:predicted nucleotidyltransferase